MKKKSRRTFRQKLNKRLEKLKRRQKIRDYIDSDEPFYRVKDLNICEVEYLLTGSYSRHNLTYQQDIFGNFGYYLIANDSFESPEHFFLVHHIADILSKNGISAETYRTTKPDIIFAVKNRKIACEVETGKTLKHAKKQFLRKVEILNETFGDDWFFIVTNRNYLSKYKKYGKVVTRKRVLKMLSRYVGFPIEYQQPSKPKNKFPTY